MQASTPAHTTLKNEESSIGIKVMLKDPPMNFNYHFRVVWQETSGSLLLQSHPFYSLRDTELWV